MLILVFFFLVAIIIFEFPTSPEIITISSFIIASPDPTCSDEEISSLEEAATQVDEGLEEIEAALEEAETILEGNDWNLLTFSLVNFEASL